MPKLHDISDAIAARLASITTANGYSTNAGGHIVRGQAQVNPDELPACRLYLGVRETESQVGNAARQAVPVSVEVYAAYAADPELVAIDLLADVQKAVEDPADTTLGGLLRDRLAWESDEIIYPESADRIVGVRVTYNAPHVRRYGNPDY